MKNLIFSALFILFGTVAFAQKLDKEVLTKKKWVLKSDVMSGVGKHTPLPENTQIEFLPNGRWVANEQVEGLKEGTWEQTKKGEIIVTMGGKKQAKVTSLTASELKMSFKNKAVKREWTWGSEI